MLDGPEGIQIVESGLVGAVVGVHSFGIVGHELGNDLGPPEIQRLSVGSFGVEVLGVGVDGEGHLTKGVQLITNSIMFDIVDGNVREVVRVSDADPINHFSRVVIEVEGREFT